MKSNENYLFKIDDEEILNAKNIINKIKECVEKSRKGTKIKDIEAITNEIPDVLQMIKINYYLFSEDLNIVFDKIKNHINDSNFSVTKIKFINCIFKSQYKKYHYKLTDYKYNIDVEFENCIFLNRLHLKNCSFEKFEFENICFIEGMEVILTSFERQLLLNHIKVNKNIVIEDSIVKEKMQISDISFKLNSGNEKKIKIIKIIGGSYGKVNLNNPKFNNTIDIIKNKKNDKIYKVNLNNPKFNNTMDIIKNKKNDKIYIEFNNCQIEHLDYSFWYDKKISVNFSNVTINEKINFILKKDFLGLNNFESVKPEIYFNNIKAAKIIFTYEEIEKSDNKNNNHIFGLIKEYFLDDTIILNFDFIKEIEILYQEILKCLKDIGETKKEKAEYEKKYNDLKSNIDKFAEIGNATYLSLGKIKEANKLYILYKKKCIKLMINKKTFGVEGKIINFFYVTRELIKHLVCMISRYGTSLLSILIWSIVYCLGFAVAYFIIFFSEKECFLLSIKLSLTCFLGVGDFDICNSDCNLLFFIKILQLFLGTIFLGNLVTIFFEKTKK